MVQFLILVFLLKDIVHFVYENVFNYLSSNTRLKNIVLHMVLDSILSYVKYDFAVLFLKYKALNLHPFSV